MYINSLQYEWKSFQDRKLSRKQKSLKENNQYAKVYKEIPVNINLKQDSVTAVETSCFLPKYVHRNTKYMMNYNTLLPIPTKVNYWNIKNYFTVMDMY
jgi:hypothetical protein